MSKANLKTPLQHKLQDRKVLQKENKYEGRRKDKQKENHNFT